MKITLLGTAAAEGYPSPFCRCANCEDARRLGGRALRKRAAALVNDDFLIDFGPDLLPASQLHGLKLWELRYAAQTHPHDDHLFPDNFLYRSDRCHAEGVRHLQYAVSPCVADHVRAFLAPRLRDEDAPGRDHYPSFRMDLVLHRQWETIDLGPYTLLAIPAVHAPGTEARVFGIRQGGRTALYGTDTAPMPDGVWERVAAAGWAFDLVIMDCTHGVRQHSPVHHSLASMQRERERMREAGALAPHARFVAHHFAHHSTPLPDEMDRLGREGGYEVAWDGMTVQV